MTCVGQSWPSVSVGRWTTWLLDCLWLEGEAVFELVLWAGTRHGGVRCRLVLWGTSAGGALWNLPNDTQGRGFLVVGGPSVTASQGTCEGVSFCRHVTVVGVEKSLQIFRLGKLGPDEAEQDRTAALCLISPIRLDFREKPVGAPALEGEGSWQRGLTRVHPSTRPPGSVVNAPAAAWTRLRCYLAFLLLFRSVPPVSEDSGAGY